ncbi:riboflavin synthase [Roseospira visakhapatnamensis]|uniref:Riboflavin synthase n=1 Tax=Roseospira visakhapatnamensis TaxID=390880 RepID=A0A7W6RAE4_9PROT|nr:riboflavin synthase [Roseospira visakhapatnamensis]MBB4264832.1 riboflavin synthase [Roseospira visakhapatnamensis]
MFTGIVTDLGRVRRIERSGDTKFTLETRYDTATIPLGASIAHNGCCLTVIETGPDCFTVQASKETLTVTTLSDWGEGTRVNLERALAVGDELGGHIVSGHVDGIARVTGRREEGESIRFTFAVPDALKGFIAPKGSVALDGVSLTINGVEDDRFDVNIIPHTAEVTTFGGLTVGDRVNMEIDMLARYVARLLEVKE